MYNPALETGYLTVIIDLGCWVDTLNYCAKLFHVRQLNLKGIDYHGCSKHVPDPLPPLRCPGRAVVCPLRRRYPSTGTQYQGVCCEGRSGSHSGACGTCGGGGGCCGVGAGSAGGAAGGVAAVGG